MNERRLEGKSTIITGASSGIGRAAARLFARHGAHLIVGARRRTELDTLVAEIQADGGVAHAVEGDVTDEGYAAQLVDAARARYGGLDVAFNNAGTLGAMGPTVEVDRAAWTHTLEVNLTAAFLAARHQLPALAARGGGSMIFTSTFVGHTAAFPGLAAYAASKAGLIGLMRALAVEAAPTNVRVNALLPGGTDTPMGRVVAHSPEALAHVRSMHALQRIATPDEIAEAALFLASPASSFCTGIALLADGGISIHRA